MKRKLFYSLILFFAIIMISLNYSCVSVDTNAKILPELNRFSLSELREDFEEFKNIIIKEHPKLYADRVQLEAFFNQQFKALKDNQDELEFFRILSPIVAKLNCGHTRLHCGFLNNLYSPCFKMQDICR